MIGRLKSFYNRSNIMSSTVKRSASLLSLSYHISKADLKKTFAKTLRTKIDVTMFLIEINRLGTTVTSR
jgi:hypothetical protein